MKTRMAEFFCQICQLSSVIQLIDVIVFKIISLYPSKLPGSVWFSGSSCVLHPSLDPNLNQT
jgi:hypothetical protein